MYPVRGGTSILGYILSFGIILLYLMVFPFIAHADERICGLRRFALGLVYAIVYSALMVKLIDCFRVRAKHDVYNVKYSKMGRPVGLFLVTLFFVIVQVIINTEWLILEPPNLERIFYNSMYWPRCSPDDFYDEGLVLSLVYIMAIIFFSLIVGLFTYSSNKNHREARWILGILILSIPCWVIWCAVSILGAIKVRDAAVAIGLIVNATVMLALVPIRKLYLLHSYNKMLEEEEEAEEAKSQLYAGSQKGSNMYDNKPRLHDESSVRGSQLYSTAGH
uniref:G-protein coupled receptors family 3 profile domain-containing protein n=1 Tax=Biomphalaria glabrata TaxID=6526 RepID=A0A2C9KN41_BIOGL